MARSFETMAAERGADPQATFARRTQFNSILLGVLNDNPGFNGTYSAWEPGALDGNDDAYKGRQDVGSDVTGRFLPYWTRDAAGQVAVQPLVEYDSQELHPNGVMKGGWYIGPQEGKGESILAPLPYVVQGKNVYLATMSVPIMIDGKFRGVAGADFDLGFVQKIAVDVKKSIYGGSASVSIVSNDGLVVASSEKPEAIGQSMDSAGLDAQRYLPIVRDGRADVSTGTETTMAVTPVVLGRTNTPWSVIIELPTAVARADAAKLDAALASRNADDRLFQFIVALVVGLIGIAIMWIVARSIASPIGLMTAAMRRLANRDLATDIPGVGRGDEIGRMAETVQVFKDNALRAIELEGEAKDARSQTEVERARTEDMRRKLEAEQKFVVESLAYGLDQIANGNLTADLDKPFPDDYRQIQSDFNAAIGKLRDAMGSVALSVQSIKGQTAEISTASDDMARRTEQQAASLEETAAALSEVTRAIRLTAESAKQAADVTIQTRLGAEKSGEVVCQAVLAMGEIEKSSDQIGSIIGVIDEIAFQTNLLALNAGVEAARAGEAGRGFAVVAQEVRGLAQRSAEAAKEIKTLIATSTTQVAKGVSLVAQTGTALEKMVEQVAELTTLISGIAVSAQEQAVGLNEVNTAVNQMDQVTQQNAAMVEQSSAANKEVADGAEELRLLVSQFQTGQKTASPGRDRHSNVVVPFSKTALR
ncbi:chemotaxis protein [Aureimonas sp. SA4125]|uniref:methyl-accepting chemotaxis protein n=1 Tax=Aureimonas sp. SA4125 TaxID=2826993 RepID=UPI001CC466D6|nr:methyl-accepting chemotaxis protein [Aureimonas sp. SA4125]BDA83126.1 chemotaxis protein [Aureimonas sp. SA4125]